MPARLAHERARDEARVEELLVASGVVPRGAEIIHTKVVGVTHDNDDGTSRQDAIGAMAQFDVVDLLRNPEDRFDENAIQVFAMIEKGFMRFCRQSSAATLRIQIGHLPKDVAEQLAPRIDAGETWKAIATRISFHISRGVSLLLFRQM